MSSNNAQVTHDEDVTESCPPHGRHVRIQPWDICFGNLLAYFKFVRKYTCCTNPLPDLAYANVFCTEVTVIHILDMCLDTYLLRIDMQSSLIWSNYDNYAYLRTYFGCVNKFAQHVYLLANLKYANKLLKHMSHGYIHTCPLCHLQAATCQTQCQS